MSIVQEGPRDSAPEGFESRQKAELGSMPYEDMARNAVANLTLTPEVMDNAIRGVQVTMALFNPGSATINQDAKRIFMETLYRHSTLVQGHGFIRRYQERKRIKAWVRALEGVSPQPLELDPTLPTPEYVKFYERLRREEFPQPKPH